jgi:MoaA/NifB/PqqE/SkfB family radical SAM enzyme
MKTYYFNITYECNSACLFCALNGKKKEISVDEFYSHLVNLNVQSDDIIIINGGEPTVHSGFIDILKLIKQFNCYPFLFTNGVKLSNRKFADQLADFAPMKILIPLFGDNSDYHDKLTGRKGNFEKSIGGLSNLVRLKNNGVKFEVEIKLLLSKYTASKNIEIVKMINNHYNDKSLIFSLNQLIISPHVINNKELFIERYSNLSEIISTTVETIIKLGYQLVLGIPFCIISHDNIFFTNFISKKTLKSRNDLYMDKLHKLKIQNVINQNCMSCFFVEDCIGFNEDYISYFGEFEIMPFH